MSLCFVGVSVFVRACAVWLCLAIYFMHCCSLVSFACLVICTLIASIHRSTESIQLFAPRNSWLCLSISSVHAFVILSMAIGAVVCVRVSCERPLTSQGYFGECVTVPRNRSSARSPELFVLGFICLCNKVLLILRIHERLCAFPCFLVLLFLYALSVKAFWSIKVILVGDFVIMARNRSKYSLPEFLRVMIHVLFH